MRLCTLLDTNGDDKNERMVPSVPRVLSQSRRTTGLLCDRFKFNWTIAGAEKPQSGKIKEANASNGQSMDASMFWIIDNLPSRNFHDGKRRSQFHGEEKARVRGFHDGFHSDAN